MPEDVGTKTSHEKNTKAPEGRCGRWRCRASAWRHARLAGGNRHPADARIGTVYASRTHYGGRWWVSAWVQPSEVLRED